MSIKKVLKLFVFSLLLFGISNSVFASQPIGTNYLQISGSIFKVNNKNEPLKGAKFKITDINNTFSHYSTDLGNGLYGMSVDEFHDASSTSFQKVFAMLPQKNQNDLRNYMQDSSYFLDGKTYHFPDRSSEDIVFKIPLFIEEVSAPKGYKLGEKIVVMGTAHLTNLNNRAYFLDITAFVDDGYYKFDKDFNYNDFGSDDMVSVIDNSFVRTSDEIVNKVYQVDNTLSYHPIGLVNEKGDVLLKINNYVNNSSNYTTARGKKLEYKIVVKNDGTASSTGNVVTAKVPTELEYVKGSASNGGVYNKNKHIVTWNISSIEPKGTISLRYSVYIPKDASPNIKYIGSASIYSEQTGLIQSRENWVSIVNNPKTSVPIAAVLLIFASIGAVTLIKKHKKELDA